MELNATSNKSLSEALLYSAILIREVESTLLQLFSEGSIHGTVHTCVGQEFSALAFAGQLKHGDCVFSNHRGHGHFIAFTDDVEGLISELTGKKSGVCAGIGSSQHLCAEGFFTNGIQGGIVPCAAGHALAQKLSGRTDTLGVVFIGDGTLGEGIVYESMNLASLLDIPLLIVCEDNGIAQSTPQTRALAGSILSRAAAFDIQCWSGSTHDPVQLMTTAAEAIQHVRTKQVPGFFHVRTERLNSHSKGDDERPPEHITEIRDRDFLNTFGKAQPEVYGRLYERAMSRIRQATEKALGDSALTLGEYLAYGQNTPVEDIRWSPVVFPPEDLRLVQHMQTAWDRLMTEVPSIVMIGEDIQSPYGGAFKVTKGLSDKFPERVISSPISEAGITGLANGLALAGMIPVVEIMFGDFITLALDQLLNHAAKFRHMYAGKATCPLILRTPMGGGRGYGPTHSQSLEKMVAGIETLQTVATNVLLPPEILFRKIISSQKPTVIIENKLDYARRISRPQLPGYNVDSSNEGFPTIRLSPRNTQPDVTLITYGGMTTSAIDAAKELYLEHEILAEIFVLSQIGNINAASYMDSVRTTRCLITLEEGSTACGIGAEILARAFSVVPETRGLRIGSLPVPVPSPSGLESLTLPSVSRIVTEIASLYNA